MLWSFGRVRYYYIALRIVLKAYATHILRDRGIFLTPRDISWGVWLFVNDRAGYLYNRSWYDERGLFFGRAVVACSSCVSYGKGAVLYIIAGSCAEGIMRTLRDVYKPMIWTVDTSSLQVFRVDVYHSLRYDTGHCHVFKRYSLMHWCYYVLTVFSNSLDYLASSRGISNDRRLSLFSL